MAINIDVPSKVTTIKAMHIPDVAIYSPVGEDRYLIPVITKESDKGIQQALNRIISEWLIPFYCLESYGLVLIDSETNMYI